MSVTELARAYGLPIAPRTTPVAGRGGIFQKSSRKRWLAAGFLATIVVLLLFGRKAARDSREHPGEVPVDASEACTVASNRAPEGYRQAA